MGNGLLVICASAITAVFILLAFLAVLMRALMAVFPARVDKGIDPATIAAVTAAAAAAMPGTRITKVEEVR